MTNRYWSRVTNRCLYDNENTSEEIIIQNRIFAENYAKGNVLQYKKNSANFTKMQKYSRIAQGYTFYGPRRTYATQSDTYTNPNTQMLARVGYETIEINPFTNIYRGTLTGISNQCNNGTTYKNGGTLICGSFEKPCSNQPTNIIPINRIICRPGSDSDVPGSRSFTCWNPRWPTTYTNVRRKMDNAENGIPLSTKYYLTDLTYSCKI